MLHHTLKRISQFKISTLMLFAGIALTTALMVVYMYKYYDLASNQLLIINKNSDDTISKVGSLISLPSNEEPLVSLINDNSYEGAKPGDKALIYVKSHKIIIYDEKNNKIVSINTVKIAE